MLIKNLKKDYPLVYEAALREQELQGNKRDESLGLQNGRDNGNFSWSEAKFNKRIDDSKYTTCFWNLINKANFKEAERLYPDLFKEDKKSVHDFKIGDKVKIPTVERTAGGLPTNQCTAVSHARQRRQDFLYIVEYGENSDIIVGVDDNVRDSRFYPKDLELYEKPSKNVFIFDRNDFNHTQIRVNSEEESRVFQEYLFKIGIYWASGDKEFLYPNERKLHICNFQLIRQEKEGYKIITLDQCIPNWRELLPKKESKGLWKQADLETAYYDHLPRSFTTIEHLTREEVEKKYGEFISYGTTGFQHKEKDNSKLKLIKSPKKLLNQVSKTNNIKIK